MSRYKRYERYKDSGVEWIGEIPEHWGIIKLKFLSTIFKGKNPQELTDEWREEFLPYLSMEYLRNSGDTLTLYAYPEKNLVTVNNSDILILWDGSNAGEIVEGKNGILSSTMAKIVPNNIVTRYLYWFLKGIEKFFKDNTVGMGIPHVNGETLKNHLVLLPNLQDQNSIANFLDQKTAEIDALIADKEKLIELLQEKRQAIITEAVTKGLNPSVKMKDSGIEWIGEIPEHWRTARLKFLKTSPFQYGANEPAEMDDPLLPRYIRITDINQKGELREDTFKSLSWESAQPYLLKDGDILFARSGATVGKTFLYKKELGYACYAGYLIRFKPDKNKVNSYYIYYYTLSKVYEEWIKQNIIQATIQNVSAEKYGNLQVPLPPLEEQKRIVKYLNGKIEEIDILIESIYVQIQKLKEYRQSLISEAVTGKIDVRDYVID